MDLSRTFSKTIGDCSRKSQIFPSLYLTLSLKGSPWNWITAFGLTEMMGLPGREKVSGYLCLAICIQYTSIRTDGRTDGDRRTLADSYYRTYAQRRAVKIIEKELKTVMP